MTTQEKAEETLTLDDTDRMRAIPVQSAAQELNGERGQRLVRLREQMDRRGISSLVITNPENMLYYTGYYTKAGHATQFLVLDNSGKAVVITRDSEIANVARSVDSGALIDSCICYKTELSPLDALRDVLRRSGGDRVGAELRSRWFPTDYYLAISELLGHDQIVDVSELLAAPRRVKSPLELEVMRRAGRITVDAVVETIDAVEPGITDYKLAATALNAAVRRGSEWSATWPNIGVSPISGVGHGSWSNTQVSAGDTVAVELSGVVERYHVPACRTALVGPTSPRIAEAADVLTEACAAGLAVVRGGAEAKGVYSAFNDVLKDGGKADLLTYASYGYMTGVGFPPSWANEFGHSIWPGSNFVLEPGMTFHMLAFLMEPNKWGIGQSDTIVVTENGFENLTPGLPAGPINR